jgi:hypothetical protein
MHDIAFEPVLGASGDMILGALFDLGADPAGVAASLRTLGLDEFEIRFGHIEGPHHVRYGRCEVHTHEHEHHHHHRGLGDILALIEAGALPARARERATRIFTRLAEAEAAVHGIAVEAVHFHEVGATDAIVDIVGACLALEQLAVEHVYCSALPAGTGTIRCAHGVLPNPAPATVRLLAGFPVLRLAIDAELTTPTGAAILTTLSAGDWTGRPLHWLRSGSGAGSRRLEAGPNILRAHLVAGDAPGTEPAVVLEADMDDDTPEAFAALPETLRAAGALDVTLTPLLMKKGRPGVRLTMLAEPAHLARFAELILQHSSSIGVRSYPVQRRVLPRTPAILATPWGEVRAKRVERPHGVEWTPEFDSCRELAQRVGVPVREILQAARKWEARPASPPSGIG